MKMFIELFDLDLLKVLASIPLVLGANTLLGALISKWEGGFRFDIMIKGIKKGLVVYLVIFLVVVVGYIIPDLVINFNGVAYSIPSLLYYLLYAKLIKDLLEVMNKIMTVLKIKVEDLEPQELEYEPLLEMSDDHE